MRVIIPGAVARVRLGCVAMHNVALRHYIRRRRMNIRNAFQDRSFQSITAHPLAHMEHGNNLSWIPLALAATLMGKLVLPAQDWQTVDDFALGGGHAEAHGVATDAAGGIYVVGTASGHGIVRYSADDGSSWITRADFVYPSEANTVYNAVTIDSRGAVFVGGMAAKAGYFVGHWLVRRSTDHGLTWETVDDYYRPFIPPEDYGINGVVYSLASDGQGRVYGGGVMLPNGPSYPSWWVRGSSIGGTNWDTKLLAFGGYTEFFQITCAGEDLYAAGSADGDNYPFATGIILVSSDYGATWTTKFEGIGDFPSAITADSAGYLYSAGTRWINSTSVVWEVRRAAPGSTNWTTLDRLSGEEPYASSIAVDVEGNIVVAGGFGTWFTRQYSVATGQWSTTDLFSYSTNNVNGAALGAAIAPSGSVFTVGDGTSDSGQRRWLVRKRAAPTPIAQARALENEVNDRMARGAIARKPANVLLAILDRIVAELEEGQSASVCNRLRTFSRSVQRFVKQGALAQSDGESLMNGTDNLRLALGSPERREERGQR